MPLLATSDFPPPKNDKEFEEMVRDIFATHWSDPDTKIFGRSGQEQRGVDVYGRPNQQDFWFGIQCKVRKTGKLSRKTLEDEKQLIKDAIAVEKAGAFAIVVEGVMSNVAKKITEAVNIPIIGIGAGNVTDGQVLVWSDMLGLFSEFKPKFVRHYMQGASLVRDAVNQYRNDVQDSSFPSREEEY